MLLDSCMFPSLSKSVILVKLIQIINASSSEDKIHIEKSSHMQISIGYFRVITIIICKMTDFKL